jgi:hypothetical protein
MNGQVAIVALDTVMTVDSRPLAAGRDWPLYGEEYGRMKFGSKGACGYLQIIRALKYGCLQFLWIMFAGRHSLDNIDNFRVHSKFIN